MTRSSQISRHYYAVSWTYGYNTTTNRTDGKIIDAREARSFSTSQARDEWVELGRSQYESDFREALIRRSLTSDELTEAAEHFECYGEGAEY